MDDFLSKPFTIVQLRQVLTRWLLHSRELWPQVIEQHACFRRQLNSARRADE